MRKVVEIKSLENCRKKIEAVDRELQKLFLKRVQLVNKVRKIKKTADIRFKDLDREIELLNSLVHTMRNPKLKAILKKYHHSTMRLSQSYSLLCNKKRNSCSETN